MCNYARSALSISGLENFCGSSVTQLAISWLLSSAEAATACSVTGRGVRCIGGALIRGCFSQRNASGQEYLN